MDVGGCHKERSAGGKLEEEQNQIKGRIEDEIKSRERIEDDLMEKDRGLVVASAPVISVQTPTGG